MLPSIAFNLTEGLVNRFAVLQKQQAQLAASVTAMSALVMSLHYLPEHGERKELDHQARFACRVRLYDHFGKCLNILAARKKGIEEMILYLEHFDSIPKITKELHSEIKKGNFKEVKFVEQAEFVIFVGESD